MMISSLEVAHILPSCPTVCPAGSLSTPFACTQIFRNADTDGTGYIDMFGFLRLLDELSQYIHVVPARGTLGFIWGLTEQITNQSPCQMVIHKLTGRSIQFHLQNTITVTQRAQCH
jgi:hypothetical protein